MNKMLDNHEDNRTAIGNISSFRNNSYRGTNSMEDINNGDDNKMVRTSTVRFNNESFTVADEDGEDFTKNKDVCYKTLILNDTAYLQNRTTGTIMGVVDDEDR